MAALPALAIDSCDPAALTLEAWAALEEDAPGELVDGRLVEEEMPSVLHEAVVAWLIRMLGAWAIPGGGRVFGSEFKLAVAPRRGRKPDISVYGPGSRLPAKRSAMSPLPPSAVIEILSPNPRDTRRDRVDKLYDYAHFGVRFYWILDPELRILDVLELGVDGRYTIALAAAEGAHPIPGCEGLLLDLDALWAEIDALPDDEDEREATGA